MKYCYVKEEPPTKVAMVAYDTHITFLDCPVRVLGLTTDSITHVYVDLDGYSYPPVYVMMRFGNAGETLTHHDVEDMFSEDTIISDHPLESAIKKLLSMALENAVFGYDIN